MTPNGDPSASLDSQAHHENIKSWLVILGTAKVTGIVWYSGDEEERHAWSQEERLSTSPRRGLSWTLMKPKYSVVAMGKSRRLGDGDRPSDEESYKK